ncbi:MAG: SDR family NAD(P)-dependent oxidoreductase [bacterium]|nr:SDR family NAD(P)-dependent oxidoreductase [bacterium]
MSAMKGKLVLITGASAGIGEACARRFAAAGCDLLLAARRDDRLRRLKGELEKEFGVSATAAKLDVRDRDAVERFARDLAKGAAPDILINNAGLASGLSLLHEGDFEDWDRMIDTNVKGLLNVSRLVVPMMVERNSGHVINIGSVAGHLVYPKGNVYNATKFAVRALSEGMNLDLVGTNIRVSSIDPGMTETEFSEVRFHGDKEQARAAYEGFKPLAAEDIADAVFYVASAPEHVSVVGMVILPTAQRSPFVIHRDDN